MANEKIVNRENLKAFRQAYDTRLENGSLVPEKSQTAKNLLPVSSASGSTQTAPFINQGTATNNNDSQAEVDTGTLGQHLEKQGHTLAVNQLVNVSDTTSTSWNGGTFSISSGKITVVCNASESTVNAGAVTLNIPIISGHKYLSLGVGLPSEQPFILYSLSVSLPINAIQTASASGTVNLRCYKAGGFAEQTTYTFYLYCIDLTQWFNGDIPQDLLDNPENFFHYYNGSLAYNTGTLVNCNGRYLVNGYQNIINPDNTYHQVIPNRGYIYKHSSGTATTITYYDKDKNVIDTASVSSATSPYSNASFTTPCNCCFISSSVVANCMVCLFYDNESYDEVVAYKEPKVYDTGDEVLRQAGSVKDYKEPDGTIHRLVGSVDLGSLSWTYVSDRDYSYASLTSRKPQFGNIISDKYPYAGEVSVANMPNGTIRGDASVTLIYVKGVQNPTGNAYYELATPTTEQGTPFSENMDINDMGNMAWYSAYTDETTNTPVQVPQGCKIFYPAWYVGFLDSLGQRADIEWSAEKVASITDIAFKELDSSYIGAITSTTITTNFYKNEIAISGGLTDAKYVSVLMSNGNIYPMMKTSSSLVVFNGINFQTESVSVSKIYYKE